MIKEAKANKNKVIVSFHSIDFESKETESGINLIEERLLYDILPWIDLSTVFTDGAYRAVIRKFPQYKDKVVVLRHGVHVYPQMSEKDARKRLLRHRIDRAEISATVIGTCVVGRRIEGIGETLDLAKLPSDMSAEDLAEKITRRVLDPKLKGEADRARWHYTQQFSFENQAKKHILFEEVVRSRKEIAGLDRGRPDFTFILPSLSN